ncbi:efflux RND transporter periplasmic adaptor subunit [Photobacterium lutimaris]|uniref:Efflux RND transporter periplasmic adaptor subunit n=1 Tax=Photobacterium lutimaris TaxID=388278 RepID=A0A2T3J1H7_9GAMM|nr:efflux RND transporter periplasmic adaptor subunit [Photobacterium lutimaris]PSU34900.1 efflux RND transporter periplasmic adaptor subunit [Photobacterium lutimaris]TDR77246.1 multidrug efflux system membrane fusion protein [Photobacterium lutimaris]
MISLKELLRRKPWILSAFILLGIGLWLFSGHYSPPSDTSDSQALKDHSSSPPPLAKVVTEQFMVQPVTRTLSLYGRTAPNRKATLGAEVAGKVDTLLVRKGQHIKTGQPLIQLDKADRELQLARANAILKVRNQEFNASKSLRKRGLQGEVAFSQAEANLIEAKAQVRSLELALTNTEIYAPFDGVIERLYIEKGDYLGVGDPIISIVDLNPLVISADVSERHIDKVYKNQKAEIELVTGFVATGTLSFRGAVANESTNTYPIEVEISNPDMALTAGTSANLELLLATEPAIKITPSMLALDEAGNLGIKTLAAGDKVHFVPISIVKVEPDGVWLAGTENTVEIITTGQGFVRDGDTVIPVRRHSVDLDGSE